MGACMHASQSLQPVQPSPTGIAVYLWCSCVTRSASTPPKPLFFKCSPHTCCCTRALPLGEGTAPRSCPALRELHAPELGAH
jgi:hypothetical protein